MPKRDLDSLGSKFLTIEQEKWYMQVRRYVFKDSGCLVFLSLFSTEQSGVHGLEREQPCRTSMKRDLGGWAGSVFCGIRTQTFCVVIQPCVPFTLSCFIFFIILNSC